MMANPNPLRPGTHTATAWLAVEGVQAAHEFYRQAFDAHIGVVLETQDGRVVHGEVRIGDTVIVVVDEMPAVGLVAPARGGTCTIALAVENADAMFARAVALGARAVAPVHDSFAGERHGLLVCPFGHRWIISTRTEDLSDQEIVVRFEALQNRTL
jgi:PhnB protein